MIRSKLLFLAAFFALLAAMLPARDSRPLKTVDSVDLQRYAGDWYEIARYPNRFQKDCDSDVHVRYTLQSSGKLNIRNECRKANGKPDVANGTAKVVDAKTNAKLKVTFFWPFYGDYWIIDLDPQYRYAVVGEPGRKYLWILSRAKELDRETFQHILQRVAENGYDTSKLVKTRQSLATAEVVSPALLSRPLPQLDSNQRTF
jgi:apolipoprotein D and lipocalin family protein